MHRVREVGEATPATAPAGVPVAQAGEPLLEAVGVVGLVTVVTVTTAPRKPESVVVSPVDQMVGKSVCMIGCVGCGRKRIQPSKSMYVCNAATIISCSLSFEIWHQVSRNLKEAKTVFFQILKMSKTTRRICRFRHLPGHTIQNVIVKCWLINCSFR